MAILKKIADGESLTDIANALRNKTGESGLLTFPGSSNSGMIGAINSLVKLPALSNPASSSDVLYPKKFIDGTGAEQTGGIKVQSKNATVKWDTLQYGINPDTGYDLLSHVGLALSGDVYQTEMGIFEAGSSTATFEVADLPFVPFGFFLCGPRGDKSGKTVYALSSLSFADSTYTSGGTTYRGFGWGGNSSTLAIIGTSDFDSNYRATAVIGNDDLNFSDAWKLTGALDETNKKVKIVMGGSYLFRGNYFYIVWGR